MTIYIVISDEFMLIRWVISRFRRSYGEMDSRMICYILQYLIGNNHAHFVFWRTPQTVLWESEWQHAFVSGRVVTELVIYQASTGYISLYIFFFCKQIIESQLCRQPWVTVLYKKKCFKLLQSIHAQMLVKTFYQAP